MHILHITMYIYALFAYYGGGGTHVHICPLLSLSPFGISWDKGREIGDKWGQLGTSGDTWGQMGTRRDKILKIFF
jgi:hypothetical protein